ncbi:MAG TPA: sugar nucleotide-binding protein, partial [Planctomycetota bacterium]|nr:sugar nucleotide-binding protein [Planctomycetota bacterium]
TQPRNGAQWENFDLQMAEELPAAFDRWQPSHVVLAAAMSRAAACEADPAAAEASNVVLPARIARICGERGIRLVHLSTDQVFGAQPPPRKGFAESEPVAPVSVYGRTKAAGEAAVLEAYPQALVVRLPLLYGDSAGRGLGASDSLLEAVERDEKPALFTDEFRTPLEVRNAADAVVELMLGNQTGRLHLAGPDRVSRLELGLAILAAMGLPSEERARYVRPALRQEEQASAPRPADASLDASRAARILETRLLGVRAGLERAIGA